MLHENIRIARQSIKSARFRSFLTMVGIIIGVASVVTTASLGEGIKNQISGQAENVGNDLITVRPGKLVNRDDNGNINGINLLSFLSASSINEKDYNTIKDDPNVETAVPLSVINGVPSIDKDRYDEAFIMSTNENLPKVMSQKVEFGNFFDESDSDRNVAVIGQKVAEKLFKENVPLSKSMQIRGENFVVVGVLERSRGNYLNPEADFNNAIFVPYETGKDLSGAGGDLKIYETLVRPKDKQPQKVDQAIGSITNGLKANHEGQEDFTVLRQQDVVSAADSLVKLVTKTVTIMAAIALFVGGIGIMNVMLVSVTERTREIGIRKAVGATNRQIQAQFLTEAAVLSLWGAFVGVIISGLINILLRIFTELQPVITWQAVAVSALAAIAVGVVFGAVPAFKAARKDPIEALRSY